MNNLSQIFYELFRTVPHIISIPNWSHLSAQEFILSNGLDAPALMHLAISARSDSQMHYYKMPSRATPAAWSLAAKIRTPGFPHSRP